MHHSLNMHLPRGWYQVAGLTPHTFRRHCLSSKSGTLELQLLDPEPSDQSGEDVLDLLKQTLVRLDIRVGEPLKSGHEECAAGVMAYAVYKHIGGQREYWIIPHEEATVFACWQMGAMTTAGMERHDIHEMLKALNYEDVADEDDEVAGEAASEEESSVDAGAETVVEDYQPEEAVAEEEGTEVYASQEYAEAEETDEAVTAEEGGEERRG